VSDLALKTRGVWARFQETARAHPERPFLHVPLEACRDYAY
jgi:hypothetical protein